MDETLEELKLTDYLVGKIFLRASGRSDEICRGNLPRDLYFIGNLRPATFESQSELSDHASIEQSLEREKKLSPVSVGGDFKISPTFDQIIVSICLEWLCFYRVFPTYEEQLNYQRQPDLLQNTSDFQQNQKSNLFIKFKKIPCKASASVSLRFENKSWCINYEGLQDAISKEIERAKSIVINDEESIKTPRNADFRIKINSDDLDSQERYDSFISSLKYDVIPEWCWDVSVTTYQEDGEAADDILVLSFEFTNRSLTTPNSQNIEGYFFDPKFTVNFEKDGVVLPFQVDLSSKNYRYDQKINARGFNCSIDVIDRKTFQSNNMPKFWQMRYQTKVRPVAGFEELASDPIPCLNAIGHAMSEYLKTWDDTERQYLEKFDNWNQYYREEFLKDKRIFESEIVRFNEGLDLIKSNPDILLAFKLTNETFKRAGLLPKVKRTQWRLFQIVFLVSQIPDMAALEPKSNIDPNRRQFVDIIYFPTGGGKTEAYLAVTVFHCFFDRLRGKQAGTSAWVRFPLRLLTLQQTQRMADIIGIAELIRHEQSDPRLNGLNIDGFAVGYFVGKSSTPNEIEPPHKPGAIPKAEWAWATDQKARQAWKKIVKCPACNTKSVVLDFDKENIRLIHRCTNSYCKFYQGEIPIYITDIEIYRYLPSVIVGTIDKLAHVGIQRKMSQMLGVVDGKCEQHGYSKAGCPQKGCKNDKIRPVSQNISGPTLFIQDELHLLKEGLGTFDGHYETFVQQLLKKYGNSRHLKIIASSATIEAFERQVEHLYGRKKQFARIFPGPGPTLRGSFYAETIDRPSRIYLGIIPHNKTILRAIYELIQYYHEEVEILKQLPINSQNPYGGTYSPGSDEWFNLIDIYSTSLTYFLKSQLLDSINTDINNAMNPDMSSKGYSQLTTALLTGDTPSDDVTKTLEILETPKPRDSSEITSVLATSMVSHGVDIDRLNAMIFYGMPRLNAEYIQASSRVGRSHIGIVFCCFDPIRERDQSHYAYFHKFHEFLGQLVEPVAINRWSKYSIDRTFSGLFMGVLLQVIANESDKPGKYYRLEYLKKQISEGKIKVDDFFQFLIDSYLFKGDYDDLRVESVTKEVRELTQRNIDAIVAARPVTRDEEWVSSALIPHPPMTSLRDIEEKIDITLDGDGWNWGTKSRKVN